MTAATTPQTAPRRARAGVRPQMRAILQHRYGTADSLSVGEIDRPVIGAGEVLVQVRAAGLDRGTWHLMAGLPYALRLGFGLRAPEEPRSRLRSRGRRRRGRSRRHALRAGRRGLRHRQGRVRRVRGRARGQARPQAVEAHLRAGRGDADLGPDRAAGPHATPGACRPDSASSIIGASGGVGTLRGADRQGARRRGHRRLQHEQGRPRPVDRRRPRRGLHPRGLRRRPEPRTT